MTGSCPKELLRFKLEFVKPLVSTCDIEFTFQF